MDRWCTDIAWCRNDILYRFWKTGRYEKRTAANVNTDEAHVHKDGCKETLSPAMDILVSSNFERLMWLLAEGMCLTCAIVCIMALMLTWNRFRFYCRDG
jgi:threonine synthase